MADRLAPDVSPARARVSQVEDRLHKLSEHMSGGVLPREASKWARDTFGVTRRQANRYVAAVQRRWAQEASGEPLEDRRSRVRAMLYDALQRCYEKSGGYVNKDGEFVDYADPDMKAAVKLLELIARFEGVVDPQHQAGHSLPQPLLVALHQHYYGDSPPAPLQVVETQGEAVALPEGEDGDGSD